MSREITDEEASQLEALADRIDFINSLRNEGLSGHELAEALRDADRRAEQRERNRKRNEEISRQQRALFGIR